MKELLVSGTDTDVGKTFVTVALAAYWQCYQLNKHSNDKSCLSIFKLMQTGMGDRELYGELYGESKSIDLIVPLSFLAPLAPPIAAAKENKVVDLGEVWRQLKIAQERSNLVLIESLGGLGSPLSYELTVGDIASEWRLPSVLVVPIKLGAIASAVANVALARSLNIDLKGIILNCSQPEAEKKIEDLTPIDLIQSLTQVPIIGTLPHIKNLKDTKKLASIVANWDLELMDWELIPKLIPPRVKVY